MWVVKLGGSLYESRHLPLWLKQLTEFRAGKAVVVPGGGPFADQVRQAQERWGIADNHAHRMALLAMEQFGHLLLGLESRLCPAASLADISRVLARQRVAVWLPATELLGHPEIPESWDITSDSLAAWLGGKLRASRLILAKWAPLPMQSVSAQDLATQGVVDAAFPYFLRLAAIPCYCVIAGNYQQITGNTRAEFGTRVLL